MRNGRMDAAELRDRLSVYYVADPEQTDRDVLELVSEALAGGATAVQLRAKQMDGRQMFDLAVRMRERCAAAGAIFLVNDRVDIAVAAGGDGVHVGVNDLPLPETRALVGRNMIVGYSPVGRASVQNSGELGADYIGIGPVYATGSKPDAEPPLGLEGIAALVAVAPVPTVAIGGIQLTTAGSVIQAGVDGIAVISAIQGAEDARAATAALALAVQTAKGNR